MVASRLPAKMNSSVAVSSVSATAGASRGAQAGRRRPTSSNGNPSPRNTAAYTGGATQSASGGMKVIWCSATRWKANQPASRSPVSSPAPSRNRRPSRRPTVAGVRGSVMGSSVGRGIAS